MKHAASLAVLVACTALGFAPALAQDRQGSRPDQQDRQESRSDQQEGPRSGLTETRIRGFYDRMEEALRQAVNSQNYGQAAQFLRHHLSEDATYVTTNTLSINGRQVATTVVTLDDDAYSALLGFVANAMQGGGRRNVQDYQLEIEVLNIEPTRRQDSVRVNTVFRESGVIRSSDMGPQSGNGQSQRNDQLSQRNEQLGQWDKQNDGQRNDQLSQRNDENDSRRQQEERQGARDQQRSQDNGMVPRGSLSRGLGLEGVRFQTTTQCEQQLRLGNDNQIDIGNTQCRTNMEIDKGR